MALIVINVGMRANHERTLLQPKELRAAYGHAAQPAATQRSLSFNLGTIALIELTIGIRINTTGHFC